ncbi:hypothetical protein AB4K01_16220 [Serratia fonticola]|uniref:hypothetical protein n=1 Tax=Serratia fonticola TaxID=47917 RepID=UPI0034C64211
MTIDEKQLEAIKWHQKIQEITYLEAGQHLRSLNQLMWQIPSFVIAINGGLWYGATLLNFNAARSLLVLIFFFDIVTIITLFRIRGLLDIKIGQQVGIENSFRNDIFEFVNQSIVPKKRSRKRNKPKHKKTYRDRVFNRISKFSNASYTVISCWSSVLLLCATFSIVGVFFPEWFLGEKDEPEKYEISFPVEHDTLTCNDWFV